MVPNRGERDVLFRIRICDEVSPALCNSRNNTLLRRVVRCKIRVGVSTVQWWEAEEKGGECVEGRKMKDDGVVGGQGNLRC